MTFRRFQMIYEVYTTRVVTRGINLAPGPPPMMRWAMMLQTL